VDTVLAAGTKKLAASRTANGDQGDGTRANSIDLGFTPEINTAGGRVPLPEENTDSEDDNTDDTTTNGVQGDNTRPLGVSATLRGAATVTLTTATVTTTGRSTTLRGSLRGSSITAELKGCYSC
jgi:hypothetical protein